LNKLDAKKVTSLGRKFMAELLPSKGAETERAGQFSLSILTGELVLLKVKKQD